jgi:CDP-diglyceride synthetase
MTSVFNRLVTGSALVVFVSWVLFAAPLWVFALITVLFTGLGLNEFFTLVERKGIVIERWIGLGIGLIIPLSIYLSFEPTKGWELFFMMLAFLTLFLLQLGRRDSSQAIVGVSTALFGIFYVSWCFSFLIKLRFLQGPALPGGEWLVALLILTTKGGDVGAYVIGSGGSARLRHGREPSAGSCSAWERPWRSSRSLPKWPGGTWECWVFFSAGWANSETCRSR